MPKSVNRRGERRWIYTVSDVAEASGCTVAQIKYARKLGEIDLGSLESVSQWVEGCRTKIGWKEISEEE